MTDVLQTEADGVHGGAVLLSIVYSSVAAAPFSELDLALLLSASRMSNEARAVSGVLLHREGMFLQVLEGPEPTVRALFRTISADPRHRDVRMLHEELVPDRRFGSWAMGYRVLADKMPAWFGSPEALEHREPSRAEELLARFRDR